MASLTKFFRRRRELAHFAPEMRHTAQALAQAQGHPVILKPAATKGGYDEIYYALRPAGGSTTGRATERFAVVRINSPYKTQNDPIHPHDPSVPLDATGRLDREWNAYRVLGPLGLSPQALWRSDVAIACSWLQADRVSRHLARQRDQVWTIAQGAFALVAHMHAHGVVHLDLNLGNLLIDPANGRLQIIDFEFGPAHWAQPDQQQAFDYLRLVEDFIKPRRGGDHVAHDPQRLAELLAPHVPASAAAADLSFGAKKLSRLVAAPPVYHAVRRVFSGLPERL